jgi:hypothetical protein
MTDRTDESPISQGSALPTALAEKTGLLIHKLSAVMTNEPLDVCQNALVALLQACLAEIKKEQGVTEGKTEESL